MVRASTKAAKHSARLDAKVLSDTQRRDVAILVVTTFLCLVPFVAKPLYIDDPLFAWCAQHITTKPLDFYGFKVNWGTTPEPMYLVTQNPPLTCYWLAVVGKLSGWGSVALHLAMLPWAIGAIVGTYALARLLTGHALWAGLAALSMPVFMISATSLMCDVMMTALWTWAVFFWILGHNKQLIKLLFVSSALASMALLTKYFAISLIPLLLVYALVKRRLVGWSLLALLVPVLTLLAFDAVCRSLYGHSPLLGARSYVESFSAPRAAWAWLIFPGGCVLTFGLFLPLLGPRILVASFVVGITIGLLAGSIQAGCFAAAGAALIGVTLVDSWVRRDVDSLLLALWIAGTIVFAVRVNWTTNGRSVLPLAPAAAIILVRRLEIVGWRRLGRTSPMQQRKEWLHKNLSASRVSGNDRCTTSRNGACNTICRLRDMSRSIAK